MLTILEYTKSEPIVNKLIVFLAVY